MVIELNKKKERYFSKFISAEEFLKIANVSGNINLDNASTEPNSNYTKETILEELRKEFNCPTISDYRIRGNERDTYTFTLSCWSHKEILPEVPPGFYTLAAVDYEPVLIKRDFNPAKILPIHTELKELIIKADFTKKNNVLIYGDPGNGKTQSVMDIVASMPNLIVIVVESLELLKHLSKIDPNVKKLLIFEEFTETLKQNDKRQVLNFLDGIDSINNAISILSTNYPKELEANIINRPSRVRHFIEYKNPNNDQINIIATHFGVSAEFFYKKDYSVDNIINIILRSKEDGVSLEDSENSIKKMRKFLSETFKGVFGFGSDD